jgi:hypothetical protein
MHTTGGLKIRIIQQDKPCRYKPTLRCVRVTIIFVKSNRYKYCVGVYVCECVCVPLFCILTPFVCRFILSSLTCQAVLYFSHCLENGAVFKKVIDKKCRLNFSTMLIFKMSYSKKNLARY